MRSHRPTVLSNDAVASTSPFGDQATDLTVRLCPVGITSCKLNTHSFLSDTPDESCLYEKRRTSLSVEQEAKSGCFELHARLHAVSACPFVILAISDIVQHTLQSGYTL